MKILTPGNITGWKGKFVLRTAPHLPVMQRSVGECRDCFHTCITGISLFCTLLYFNKCHQHVFNSSWIALTLFSCTRVSPKPAVHSLRAEPWHLHVQHAVRVCGPLSSSKVLTVYMWVLTPETFKTLHKLFCDDFVLQFYLKPGWGGAEGKGKLKERGKALFGIATTARHLTEAILTFSGVIFLRISRDSYFRGLRK